jgi:four helix bundle protein
MSAVESFRDLFVWQRSMELTVALYRLTKEFPADERFGLTSQLRRAGVSVASNIAEGHSRLSTGEYKHFLGMARGSNSEIETQLILATQLGFGDRAHISKAEGLSREVAKMLDSLIHKL